MQEDTTDKMLVDSNRGFVMGFFNSPEIERLNLQEIASYFSDLQYGEYSSADDYNCKIVVDHQPRMVLMTGVHSDGHIIIRSELRPLELSLVLKDLPQGIRELINGALKGHLPDVSDLAEAWFNSTNEHDRFEASLPIINKLPSSEFLRRVEDFTQTEAFNIMQAEYGVTKHDADRPVLLSEGAGPCVILSVYNEAAKKGFLSHIDDAIDLGGISAGIFDLRDNVEEPLVAHMVGGWSDTYSMVADIMLRLEEQPNTKIAGWNREDSMLLNLALDSRDGHIYQSFNSDQVDKGPMVLERDHRILASFNGGLRPALPAYHYTTGRDTVLAYTN